MAPRWPLPLLLLAVVSLAGTAVCQTATVAVDSAQPWFNSGYQVTAGSWYDIEVVPAGQTWFDASIESTAAGYSVWYMNPLQWMTRQPQSLFFALIGCYSDQGDGGGNCFPVGLGTKLQAQRDGTLFFYANDVTGFYFNNRGSVTVQISRADRD